MKMSTGKRLDEDIKRGEKHSDLKHAGNKRKYNLTETNLTERDPQMEAVHFLVR